MNKFNVKLAVTPPWWPRRTASRIGKAIAILTESFEVSEIVASNTALSVRVLVPEDVSLGALGEKKQIVANRIAEIPADDGIDLLGA